MESVFAAALVLIAAQAIAQVPAPEAGSDSVATPAGQDVAITVSRYNYQEPDAPGISIHGAKVGVDYTGTWSLDRRNHWFAQANVRGLVGTTT